MVELALALIGAVLLAALVCLYERRNRRLETELFQAEKTIIAREREIARGLTKIGGHRTTIKVQEQELWHCHREIDSLRARLNDATCGLASCVSEAVPSTRPDELSADIARIDMKHTDVFGDDSPALQRTKTPISGRAVGVAS